jgi:hypothetical protein
MLHKHKKDAGKMMGKQKEYYRYFCKYYDAYCALYVGMRFQFYMELIKKLLPAKKKIHKLDVKNFTDAIEKDIRATVRILTNDNEFNNEFDSDLKEIDDEFDSDFKRIDTGDYIPGKFDKHLPHDNDSPIAVRIPVSKNKQEDIIFELEETAGQIAAIGEKIRQAAMHLITIQSHEIIGGTSPLADANILNRYTQNHDFEEIIVHSKKLNDEYDRFAAEIELSADSGGRGLFRRK